jgi:putative membrane protein
VSERPLDVWQRTDPRMLLIQPLVELAKALPVLVPLLLFGRSSAGGPPWGLIGALIVAVLAAVRWATTTYQITPHHIQVRKGLVRRTTRTVPRDRIRTVDVTAHPLHRLLGLARVAAGTGRSDQHGDEGITLDGLTAARAESLREQLVQRTDLQPAPAQEEPIAEELVRLDLSWVRFAPFTLSGVVTVLALAGVLWNAVNESHVDPTKVGPVNDVEQHLRSVSLMVAALEVFGGLLVVVCFASVVGYLLTYWAFRLDRLPQGTLHVSRGLLTRRATTIEGRRLRGAEVSQPLLLRGIGGARTLAITTGLRVGRGAERGGTVLVPPAPVSVARHVAAEVVGSAGPVFAELRGHGPAATRRRYTRALAAAGLVLAAAGLAWWAGLLRAPAWWLVVLVLPVAVVLAADRSRALGHLLVDDALVSSSGSLARRRTILAREGIIGWGLRSSWFQRRVGLVTLTATTAAGRQRYDVLDVPAETAVALAAYALPDLVVPFLQSGQP